MSRRCFDQPSLADAFVRAYSKAGGFLDDSLKTIEWSAFDVLLAQINANAKGAPGYPYQTSSCDDAGRPVDEAEWLVRAPEVPVTTSDRKPPSSRWTKPLSR